MSKIKMSKIITTKIIGILFVAALIGTSVVAWSRSSATGPKHPVQMGTIAPDRMHTTSAARAMPVQKMHNMSFVYSQEH